MHKWIYANFWTVCATFVDCQNQKHVLPATLSLATNFPPRLPLTPAPTWRPHIIVTRVKFPLLWQESVAEAETEVEVEAEL